MADSVSYLAKTDCLVFGKYRCAGEEFKAPEWQSVYSWPMPDFLEIVGAQATDEPSAPKKLKARSSTAAVDLG